MSDNIEYEYSVRFSLKTAKGKLGEIDDGDWMGKEEAEKWLAWTKENAELHGVSIYQTELVKRRKAGKVEKA